MLYAKRLAEACRGLRVIPKSQALNPKLYAPKTSSQSPKVQLINKVYDRVFEVPCFGARVHRVMEGFGFRGWALRIRGGGEAKGPKKEISRTSIR